MVLIVKGFFSFVILRFFFSIFDKIFWERKPNLEIFFCNWEAVRWPPTMLDYTLSSYQPHYFSPLHYRRQYMHFNNCWERDGQFLKGCSGFFRERESNYKLYFMTLIKCWLKDVSFVIFHMFIGCQAWRQRGRMCHYLL